MLGALGSWSWESTWHTWDQKRLQVWSFELGVLSSEGLPRNGKEACKFLLWMGG